MIRCTLSTLHKPYSQNELFVIGTLVGGVSWVLGSLEVSSAVADREGGGGTIQRGVGRVTVRTKGARVVLVVAYDG